MPCQEKWPAKQRPVETQQGCRDSSATIGIGVLNACPALLPMQTGAPCFILEPGTETKWPEWMCFGLHLKWLQLCCLGDEVTAQPAMACLAPLYTDRGRMYMVIMAMGEQV